MNTTFTKDASGGAAETRENAAIAFRLAAKTARTSSPSGRLRITELAAQLTAHSIKNGWLTVEQVATEAATAHDLDTPIDQLYDRLADLIEPQPNTRAKVVARLREIGVALLPLVEDNEAAHIFIAEATMLEHGAVAAGWVDQDAVDRQFALGYASVAGAEMADRNQGYIKDLNWLADQIENVGATAQGDGATAPFTDISTEASKRAAIANELRTVGTKLKAQAGSMTTPDRLNLIDQEVVLEEKAIELGFVTDEEVNQLFAEGRSMDDSNEGFATVVGVLANRIEQGAAQQEKVA